MDGSRTLLLLGLIALLLIETGGCSKSPLGAEVKGIVTLDGSPLESGSILFAPSDGMSNNASAAVDAYGNYELRSNRTVGLVPGRYNVSVAMYERVDVKPGERSMVEPRFLTPAKYRDVKTSGLEYEVVPGQNTINIELTSGSAP